jgi:FkbM family methyltransferase
MAELATAARRMKLSGAAWLGRAKAAALTRIAGGRPLALLVESENGIFAIDIEDQYVSRHLAHGGYALNELARLEGLVDERSRVLVVGGHVGALIVPLSKRVARVEAIEANPSSFRLLEINCRINGADNVGLHPIAAADSDEPLSFVVSRTNSGGSKRAPIVATYLYSFDKPEQITVPAARLDERFSGESFDLITVDIEGSEYFALRGMPKLLASARHLVVEFVPHHLRNVAGIGVEQFLSAVEPGGFTTLLVPSTEQRVSWQQASQVLGELFADNQSDDGVVFSKEG